jgi:DNA polymerase-3 subunit gamma/tau
MAAKLSVPTLTRAWQMLLKGLFEVRDAARPIAAAEMALIRLAYATDLPPTEKLVRELMESAGSEQRGPRASAAPPPSSGPRAQSAPQPRMQAATALDVAPGPTLRTLEDIAALAGTKGAAQLKVNVNNHMHLLRMEPGQIEFRPAPNAPSSLAGDLAQKLKEWTGTRWVVTVSREGGAPTLTEKKNAAHVAKIEAVAQEPLVRAVLDRFPGAEIVAVREKAEQDIAQPTDESGGE